MHPVFALLLLLIAVSTDGARKANEAYAKGDFVTAEAGYREALLATPNDPRLVFNLGNALTQQGKYEEAVAAYEQFKRMSSDPVQRAAADYNIGNIHGAQQEWAKAADRYRESLRSNPGDAQAQHNYELARRRVTQPPPQSQPQQGEPQKNDSENPQQQQQQGPPQQQQQQQDNGSQQSDPDSGQQAREGQMSRKEAEQILSALENKEKELLKEYQKKQIPPRTRHAKDW